MNIILPILFSFCFCYKYYTYKEIVNIFDELAQKHSDKFTLHYPLKGIENTRELDCGDEECQFFYAEFVNQQVSNDLPTVLILAGFHGDEVIGQNVVTELALYLQDNTRLEFLNYRRILLYPMANPYGYYHQVREEKGFDANRDFSIDNTRRICFQTNAARALAQVYSKFIIQLGITFHGGDNSISYSWGTYNHMKNGKATEAPDDYAMALIGRIMRDIAAQNNKLEIYTYSLGKMTDEVYAVNGGYEDWAYAAGWEENSICGNRESKEYIKGSQNSRALTYLIEANNYKKPKESSLGDEETTSILLQNWPPLTYYNTPLLEKYSNYGNVNRNIMAALAIIDISYPYLIVSFQDSLFTFNFGGCYSANMAILNSNNTLVNESNITGIWDPFNEGLTLNLNQSEIYKIHYQCDQDFKKQSNPDPKKAPQSYFVQSRINSSFEYKLDEFSVSNSNSISHTLNLSKVIESPKKSIQYHVNENLNFQFNEEQPLEKQIQQPIQQTNKQPFIWWLLTVFILLTLILLLLLYKYCQKTRNDEVIEMNTIQNEDKL